MAVFRAVHPLDGSIPGHSKSQYSSRRMALCGSSLLLCLAADALAKMSRSRNLDVGESLAYLIATRRDEVASFANAMRATKEVAMGFFPSSHPTHNEQRQQEVHETHLVADVLNDLAISSLKSLRFPTNKARELDESSLKRLKRPGDINEAVEKESIRLHREDRRNRRSIPDSSQTTKQHTPGSPIQISDHVVCSEALTTIQSDCSRWSLLVARALPIYAGSQRQQQDTSALTSLATVFVTLMTFRRCSVAHFAALEKELISDQSVEQFENITATTVNMEEFLDLNLVSFLGQEKAEGALKRAISLNKKTLCAMVGNLMGCPLPWGGWKGVLRCQRAVELLLCHGRELKQQPRGNQHSDTEMGLEESNDGGREEMRHAHGKPSRAGAGYSQALHKMSASLGSMLAQQRGGEGEGGADLGRRELDGMLSGMNDMIHKQRVDQLAQFINILNTHASKRQKLLRGLMNLWAAANQSAGGDGSSRPRARGDILLRTRDIQRTLLEDMQSAQDTQTKQVLALSHIARFIFV